MPKLELSDDQLIIRLSPSEKLAAFHGDVKVNGIAIRGAAVMDKKWWATLGLRIGTGLPGLIIAGTFIQPGDRAFVSWTRPGTAPAMQDCTSCASALPMYSAKCGALARRGCTTIELSV
jgi:hypothetical protein